MVIPSAPHVRRGGVHFKTALLPQGWAEGVRVEMSRGVFSLVESGVQPRPGDRRAGIGLPGMPNLHSHAFQRGMAGLTERRGPTQDSFWTWRELMYRFVSFLSPDDVEAIAAQAYVEMLEAGFTRVGEFHYLHRDPEGHPYGNPAEMGARIAAAAERTGIALTLLPVFYAHGGFGGAATSEGQRRFVTDPGGYGRLLEASRVAVSSLPHAVVGIAPHSLRAVTPSELSAIHAQSKSSLVHIHVAEQLREVRDCEAWSGARPVQWLLNEMPVDRRWCLVHATHMTDTERVGLARSGAVAGLCPLTEANLGDGVFPAQHFMMEEGVLGVGTDSNVLIGLSEELRMLEYGQRLQQHTRNVLVRGFDHSTGRSLFEAALKGGGQALGAPGGLEVGLPADLVALKTRDPSLMARGGDALLDSFIFAGGTHSVDRVWRAGKRVVSDGRHDLRTPVRARYRKVLQRLMSV